MRIRRRNDGRERERENKRRRMEIKRSVMVKTLTFL